MRTFALAVAAGVFVAVLSGTAYAGKPDDPGAGGAINGFVKDFAGATGVTPAEVKKNVTDIFGENWGQLKKDIAPEGRPNPANDNGGGNG